MSNEIAEAQERGGEVAQTSGQVSMAQIAQRLAENPQVDVDKLERILAMQERMDARVAEQAFNKNMALMQSELPVIEKRGVIRHGNKVISTFAKFEDINEAVKPIMERYGFAASFRVDTGEQVRVKGILMHREGHREETEIVLPADTSGAKNPVQAVASSVSYGKRYVLGALLNITTVDEDDDATGCDGVAPVIERLEQAETLDQLAAIFKQAWKDNPSKAARQRITEIKDIRKEELGNG